MTKRWICARCYTSAEEAVTKCPNCGSPRGPSALFSVPDAPKAAGSTAAQPPDSAPPSAVEPAVPEPAAPEPAAPEPTFADPAAVAPAAAATSAAGGSSTERWVCLRCFASNEGTASACATCGQARGAEPTGGEPSGGEADGTGTWTAPAAPASSGGGFPWRYVVFGVIGLAVVGSTLFFAARRGDGGEITGAGDLSVQDLRVGDCFDFTDQDSTEDGGEVTSVRAIPCEEPHIYEVYVVADYPAGEEPSAPTELYTDWELDQCVDGFEAYVGTAFETSALYFSTLTPTTESWDAGDRDIQCFLHNADESAMTGSAEGSAQ